MKSVAAPHPLSLQEWSNLRTELLWVYDHAPAPTARHGVFDHRHGNWAWYLRAGEVRITTKTGTLTARSGQWLFLPSEIHRHDFSHDSVLISVRFLCQWPSGENLFAPHSGLVLDGTDHPALEKTARALVRLVNRDLPGSHYDQSRQTTAFPRFLIFQRTLLDWLAAWFQANLAAGAVPSRQSGDERVHRAARALDAAPLDAGFPRTPTTRAAGVSTVQLNRLFRNQFQLTPRQYWERRRLQFARLYLETSTQPVKELAARLGFRSDSHFTVWFKRHAGASPARYRARSPRA